MAHAKQENFFAPTKLEYGGSLSVRRHRSTRPLCTKRSLHITSRSRFAKGERSLKRNEKLVRAEAEKWAKKYGVEIHIISINGNHIHFFIKGKTRSGIQTFFKVFLAQVAQKLLALYPIGSLPSDKESQNLQVKTGCRKNQRTFWEELVYSRVVSHGREYKRVYNYIVKNILETLHKIAYEPRVHAKPRKPKFPS